jgi:hypothetical protein
MNPPKADELDYIHFLIAAQKVFTCTRRPARRPETSIHRRMMRSLAYSEESLPTLGPCGARREHW